MKAIDLAPVGGPLACLGLAFLLAARGRGLRLGGLGLLAVGSCLMAVPLVPHRHVAFVVAALVVAVLVAGGTGLLLRRWPWLVAFATLALIPVRIPVHVGGSSSKLLLPLYVLAGGAAVQIAIETLQGDERSRELGPISAPLAAFVLWTGLSLTWSSDVRTGDVELLAFFVPCGLIALALARLPWSRRALKWLTVELVGMALAFAAVGLWQYQTRNIFQNPKVIVGNAYAPFYRVNSVFWDPSIYGRFLVVAIIAALVVVVRGPSLRNAAIAAGAVVVCWIGLFFSYSQSSFGGLIAAVLIVAAVIWHRRAAMAIAVLAVVLLSASVASPHVRSALFKNSGNGLNESTSGRAGLVSNGIKIARQNPVFGVGVGAFKHAYADLTHLRGKEPKKAASHNTPVTVAAESGIPGLALLVWLVGAALVVTFRRLGGSFEHRVALAVGLATAAIFVHALFYADFFEDPTTWGLLGLAALSAAALERRREERA